MSRFTGDHSFLHCNMASIAPSSTNILLTQAVAFQTKKSNVLSRRSILQNNVKHTLPFSTSIRLFPQFRVGCTLKPKQRTLVASASGTDVAVEAADSEASVSAADAPEISGESSAAPDTSSVKAKRSRPARKSDMPPVSNEELIPGATFTGKVRTIQPFGAFVDFGAFTDGLVHVSQLSDGYVKDVANVVSIGQEVTVRLVEANLETGRISLSMRSGDNAGKAQQQKESPGSSDKSRPPRKTGQNSRRDDTKKVSKFVKGQDLQGTIKNLTRSGAFISLPEGEEGFLPSSEESDEGFSSMMGGSSFEVGQEVSVRVLRITRGQVTLTMKKEEAVGELDAKLNQGVVHTATNPFVLAFRTNQAIAAFLDEREKENQQEAEIAEEISKDTDSTAASTADDTAAKASDKEEDLEKIPDSETKDDEVKAIEEVEASSVLVGDDGNPPTEDQVTEESSLTEAKESNDDEVSAEVADASSQIVEDTKESVVDDAIVEDESSGDTSSVDATENNTEQPLSGELTDQTSPDVTEEGTSKTTDDIITADEEKSDVTENSSVAQDNEVTAVISPVESESSDGPSAETDSVVLEAESTETPVDQNAGDNSGVDVAVNGVEKQTSADPQPNGNASNSNEQSSNASPQETAVKGS